MAGENRQEMTAVGANGGIPTNDAGNKTTDAGIPANDAGQTDDTRPEEQNKHNQELQEKAEAAWMALTHVIDPEVGLDIVTMGLIYDVAVTYDAIHVEMTLTTKGCPMSAYITAAARQAIRQVYPDDEIRLQLVWDPPWTPAMINRDGLELLRR